MVAQYAGKKETQSEPACEELRCFGVGVKEAEKSGPGRAARYGLRYREVPCLPWRVLKCEPLSMGEKYEDNTCRQLKNSPPPLHDPIMYDVTAHGLWPAELKD